MTQRPDFCLTVDYEVLEYPAESGRNRKPSFAREMIEPTALLLELAEQRGCPVTIFVEVAELAFWEAHGHREIAAVREQVRGAYARGHDVQLHLHPRWLMSRGAHYDGHADCVRFADRKLVAELQAADVERELAWATDFLRGMTPEAGGTYAPTVFRAGKLQIQPHRAVFDALHRLGYEGDSSACKCMYASGYEGGAGYDFRHMWTEHQPYYPCREDINIPADPGEPLGLIEVPIFSARGQQLSLDILCAADLRDMLQGFDGSVALAISHSKIIRPNLANVAAFLDWASSRFRFTRLRDSVARARRELTADAIAEQRTKAIVGYRSSLPDIPSIVSTLNRRRSLRLARITSVVRDLLAVRGRVRILDWNCGTGEAFALPLAAEFDGEERVAITGYDPDEASILRARLRGLPGACFTSSKNDFGDRLFDLVVCTDLRLTGGDDGASILTQVAAFVAAGGLLCISVDDRPRISVVAELLVRYTRAKVLAFPRAVHTLIAVKVRLRRALGRRSSRLAPAQSPVHRPLARVLNAGARVTPGCGEVIHAALAAGFREVRGDEPNWAGHLKRMVKQGRKPGDVMFFSTQDAPVPPAPHSPPDTGMWDAVRSHAKQAALLIGGQGINLASLVALQRLLHNTMGVEVLGQFTFLVGIHTVISLGAESGWGPSVSREVALAKDSAGESRLARALLHFLWKPVAVQGLLGCLAAVFLWYFRAPSLLGPGLVLAALSAGFPACISIRDLLQGKGDNLGLAVVYGGPTALAFLFLLALTITGQGNLTMTVAAYALAQALAAVLGLFRVGAFSALNRTAVENLAQARSEYGRNIWLGRQVAVGGYIIDTPLLGIWGAPSAVAHYAIAKSICNPMGVGFGLVAQPLFRSMAKRSALPRSWQYLTWAGAAGATVSLIAVGPLIVNLVYRVSSPRMDAMLVVQSGTAGCIAVYSLYNQFLSAQGCGQILRKGGFTMGIVSAAANILLIPCFGALGACLASLASCLFWLVYCCGSYLRRAEGGTATTQAQVPDHEAAPETAVL